MKGYYMKKLLMLILVLMTGFNCLNASQKGEDPNKDRKKLTSGGFFNHKKEKPKKRTATQANEDDQGAQADEDDQARAITPTAEFGLAHNENSPFESPKRGKLDTNNPDAVARFRIESNLKAKQTRRMSNVSCNETNLDGQYTEISGSCETTPKKVQVRQIIKSDNNDSLLPPCLNPIYFNVPNNIYETPVKNPDYQSDKEEDVEEDVEEVAFIRSASQLSLKRSSSQTPSKNREVSSTASSEQKRRLSSNPTPSKSDSASSKEQGSLSQSSTPLVFCPGNAPLFSDNPFIRSESVASMTSLPLTTLKKEDANAIDENNTKLKKEETFGFGNDEEDDSDIDNNCLNNDDETK